MKFCAKEEVARGFQSDSSARDAVVRVANFPCRCGIKVEDARGLLVGKYGNSRASFIALLNKKDFDRTATRFG